MSETCESHDGMCKQITETQIAVARLEEQVKPLPKMAEQIEAIAEEIKGMKGFVAGISFVISAIFSLITLYSTWRVR